jgi:hypothetical protein
MILYIQTIIYLFYVFCFYKKFEDLFIKFEVFLRNLKICLLKFEDLFIKFKDLFIEI